MKLAIALCVLLAPSLAYADEIVGNLNDGRVIQGQLSARIGEEMNKAISCEVAKSRIEEALKDADQAQDELQDAGD